MVSLVRFADFSADLGQSVERSADSGQGVRRSASQVAQANPADLQVASSAAPMTDVTPSAQDTAALTITRSRNNAEDAGRAEATHANLQDPGIPPRHGIPGSVFHEGTEPTIAPQNLVAVTPEPLRRPPSFETPRNDQGLVSMPWRSAQEDTDALYVGSNEEQMPNAFTDQPMIERSVGAAGHLNSQDHLDEATHLARADLIEQGASEGRIDMIVAQVDNGAPVAPEDAEIATLFIQRLEHHLRLKTGFQES